MNFQNFILDIARNENIGIWKNLIIRRSLIKLLMGLVLARSNPYPWRFPDEASHVQSLEVASCREPPVHKNIYLHLNTVTT